MTAEGNLHNPAIFAGGAPVVWEIASEYLDFVERYPCPMSYSRGHLFKLCHHALQVHHNARDALAASKEMRGMRKALDVLRETCTTQCRSGAEPTDEKLPSPHWLCQPYVRPPPKPVPQPAKREAEQGLSNHVSKKRLKKLLKRSKNPPELKIDDLDASEKAARLAAFIAKKHASKPVYDLCVKCGNPASSKCVFLSCKRCCKERAKELQRFCRTHRHFSPKSETPGTGALIPTTTIGALLPTTTGALIPTTPTGSSQGTGP